MQKRMIAAVCAAALLLLPGCSRGRSGATMQVDLSQSYAAEELENKGIRYSPLGVTDRGVIYMRFKRPWDNKLYLCDKDSGEYLEIDKRQKAQPACVTQLPDGRIAALYNVEQGNKNGANVYDGKSRVMEIYDDDLHLAEEIPFPDEVPETQLAEYWPSIVQCADGDWLLFPYGLTGEEKDPLENPVVLNPDLTVQGEIRCDYTNSESFDFASPTDVALGKSGMVYGMVSTYVDETGEHSYQLYRFDTEAKTCERLENVIPANAAGICSGIDYELYYFDSYGGIYGVKDDLTSEKIVDFKNSDYNEQFSDVEAVQDGSFLCTVSPRHSGAFYIRLRPRTEEEREHIGFITMAGVSISTELVDEVCEYNRSQSDYRIIMRDYAQEFPDEEGQALYMYDNYVPPTANAIDAFKNDLLAGTVPDIIVLDYLPYRQLSNKGILTDFAPMLEADERFNPDDYYMNLFEGMKNNGRLDRMGFGFVLDTCIAKSDYVGQAVGLDPDRYADMLTTIPEDMAVFPGASREDITEAFLLSGQNTYINTDGSGCHFSDPSFVKLLELAGSVPPAEEEDPYQWNDPAYWEMVKMGWDFSRNMSLLDRVSLIKPITLHDEHRERFKDADITLIGFPDAQGGNGGRYRMKYSIALTSRSDRAEPVWEFIMEHLGSQKQSKLCMDSWDGTDSLPVMRSAMENCLKGATLGIMRPCGNATTAEMEMLRAYLEDVRMYEDDDAFINSIILEEAEKYYAGDCTAQQAADMIQSRCALYLSEQN